MIMKRLRKIFPYRLFKVNGHSMEPTINHAKLVLGKLNHQPKVNDIVVVPSQQLIKRVVNYKNGVIHLVGDNPNSSEHIITDKQTMYKVIL